MKRLGTLLIAASLACAGCRTYEVPPGLSPGERYQLSKRQHPILTGIADSNSALGIIFESREDVTSWREVVRMNGVDPPPRTRNNTIKQDAYGLGVHMDQYGRPVKTVPAY